MDHEEYSFDAGMTAYETLSGKDSDRYQYVFPYYDFTKDNLYEAIFEYQQRKRRMGGTSILKVDSGLTNDSPLSINYKKYTKISKTSI